MHKVKIMITRRKQILRVLNNFLKPMRKPVTNHHKDDSLYKTQKKLHDLMQELCENGCDEDEIPDCKGEFGYSKNNPIPINTILETHSYLSRLRTWDGEKVRYFKIGSFSSEVSLYQVECYKIKNIKGKDLAVLYLSPFQKKTSEKAPEGFKLNVYF